MSTGQCTYRVPYSGEIVAFDQMFMELCTAIPIGSKIRLLQKHRVYLVESMSANNEFTLRKLGAAATIGKAVRIMPMVGLYIHYKMGDITCL